MIRKRKNVGGRCITVINIIPEKCEIQGKDGTTTRGQFGGCHLSWVMALLAASCFGSRTVPITVHLEPFHEHVVLSGAIQPLDSVAVMAKWGGLVKRVSVFEGQTVKKGDLLAEVEVQYLKMSGDFFK